MIRRTLALSMVALLLGRATANAESFPVARVTIYPGDTISDALLDERSYALARGSEAVYALSRDAVIGKVARRTLLPGQPIPNIAIDNPRIVTVGAQIKIVFSEGAMEIVAYGIAQQAGAVGDLIRVRNQDSGLFISGRIQIDGSIRVGEG